MDIVCGGGQRTRAARGTGGLRDAAVRSAVRKRRRRVSAQQAGAERVRSAALCRASCGARLSCTGNSSTTLALRVACLASPRAMPLALSSALARASPRRALAPAPRPRRAPRPCRTPRAAGDNGSSSSNGNGAAPPKQQETWWQKVSRELDLGPAGFEDGSASGVMGAMDFGEAVTSEEEQALAAAREYVGEGNPMTKEQAAILKRRMGGSYRGFFKEWVEPKGDAVDEGIVFFDKARTKLPKPSKPGVAGVARVARALWLALRGAASARVRPARTHGGCAQHTACYRLVGCVRNPLRAAALTAVRRASGVGRRLCHKLRGLLAGAAAHAVGRGRRAGRRGGAHVRRRQPRLRQPHASFRRPQNARG